MKNLDNGHTIDIGELSTQKVQTVGYVRVSSID